MLINGKTAQSWYYMIRTKSEHILPSTGTHADAEIQIIMDDIMLAFLVRQIPDDETAPIYLNSPYAKVMKDINETVPVIRYVIRPLITRTGNLISRTLLIESQTMINMKSFSTCMPMKGHILFSSAKKLLG